MQKVKERLRSYHLEKTHQVMPIFNSVVFWLFELK